VPSTPAPGEPEAVAGAFFHGLGRLQWTRIVDLLHPDALASFDRVAGQVVESLRGDSVLIQLYGTSLEEFRSWSDRESFLRTTSAMVDYARGLMESQVTTDVEILGSVVEGDSLAHVVYRERTDHMGTVVEPRRPVARAPERRAGGAGVRPSRAPHRPYPAARPELARPPGPGRQPLFLSGPAALTWNPKRVS
jgi:hypothetical protein